VIYRISADDYRRGTINTGIGERLLPLLRFYFETGASNIYISFGENESFEVTKDNFKLMDPETRGHYIMDHTDAYRKALLKPGMRIRIFDSYYRHSLDPRDRLSCDGWTGTINYQLPKDPPGRGRDIWADTVFNVTFDEGRGKSNVNGEYLIPIV
jgi:hypothetical protein